MKALRHLHRVSLVAAVIGLGSVGTAQAFNPQPEPPGSQMVGLGSAQTARLSVVQPPDPVLPPDPCRYALAIVDRAGTFLVDQVVSVLPGQGAFVDLPGDRARLQIYALVQALGSPEAVRCVQAVKAGLEIFDTISGRTTVTVPVVPTFLPVIPGR